MAITFKVNGLDKVMRHVDPSILEQPVNEFYERCGEFALNAAKVKSPVDTGRMRSSLARGGNGNIWRLASGRIPRSLTVGTNVTHDGESYPRKLEESPVLRYRGTQYAGQKTQGWFSQSLDKLAGKVGAYLNIMAQDIETIWRRT